MPFDPTPIIRPAVSRNGVEVAKLRVLEEALRREMPEGFRWDYSTTEQRRDCGTVGCAIGLARQHKLCTVANSFAYFGLSSREGCMVFNDAGTYGQSTHYSVTPLMVADALRAIIAREEAEGGA